jgi:hypothetical protein
MAVRGSISAVREETMANNAGKQANIPPSMQPWIEARKRFRLSHAHVQMARELGLNPKKLGKLANHDQEPWKLTLQDFIVKLYMKHFGRERPETIRSIEEIAAAKQAKKQAKKAARPAIPQQPEQDTAAENAMPHESAKRSAAE